MMGKYHTEPFKIKQFWKAFNEKTGGSGPDAYLGCKLLAEETQELLDAVDNGDSEAHVLKEICDVAYVLHAVTLAYGFEDKYEAAFNLVHQNNLMKPESGTVNSDGKLVKAPDHPSVLPALRKLLNM